MSRRAAAGSPCENATDQFLTVVLSLGSGGVNEESLEITNDYSYISLYFIIDYDYVRCGLQMDSRKGLGWRAAPTTRFRKAPNVDAGLATRTVHTYGYAIPRKCRPTSFGCLVPFRLAASAPSQLKFRVGWHGLAIARPCDP